MAPANIAKSIILEPVFLHWREDRRAASTQADVAPLTFNCFVVLVAVAQRSCTTDPFSNPIGAAVMQNQADRADHGFEARRSHSLNVLRNARAKREPRNGAHSAYRPLLAGFRFTAAIT
jgi:hypothetical protein